MFNKTWRILTLSVVALALILGAVTTAQDTEPIEIYMRLSVPEVGPPPDDWYWTQAIQDDLGINVTVTFAATNEEIQPTLNLRAAANDLPDLFLLPNRSMLLEFADQGLLADWSPYVELMPDFVAERATDAVAPFGIAAGPDGEERRYGLAVQNAGPFKRALVAIRQDWLDNLGLEVPTTLDEFLAVADAFTNNDPDGNGQNDTFGWSGFFDPASVSNPLLGFFTVYAAYNALGEWRFSDDGSAIEYVPLTNNRRDALMFINQLHTAGVIDPDWVNQDSSGFNNKWKSGQVGILNSDFCATFCPQGFGEFAAANPNGVLVPIEPPTGPNGAFGGAFSLSSTNWVMSQSAVDAGKGEDIARFLNWLATDGYLLTAYGVEGENWTRDENGRIVATDADGNNLVPEPFNLPEFQAEGQARNLGYKGSAEEMRVRYENIVEHPNGQTVNPFQVLADNEARAHIDQTPFILLPVAAEAGIEAADLVRFVTENELLFITGQRSFDDWDNYVAEVENAFGVSAWVEAANATAAEIGIIPRGE